MLSGAAEETRAAAAAGGAEFDRFCTSLADGLHALAQPLTILRSSIAAAGADGVTPDRQRHYLDLSKRQAERACEIFDLLQELAIAGRGPEERGPFDAGEPR
jgi:signal transduction histidine kinase